MKRSSLFRAGARDAGLRLDEFLASRLRRLSRMRIADLLARGACAVEGVEERKAGQRLNEGEAVAFALDDACAPNSTTPEPAPLEILHEDEHLLVVVKPAGVLVHPTRGVKTGTLANALTYHLNRAAVEATARDTAVADERRTVGVGDDGNPQTPFVRPGLAHRLDRDTSGLLVVAKTQRALGVLSKHFHRRLVEKRYLAVLGGHVAANELTIDAPIGQREDEQPQWWVREEGRRAETRLRVLARSRGGAPAATTLVELEPVTGRTNQLRVHCAHLGHPIVGDRIYRGAPAPRLLLHAARLAFHHPANGAWASFDSGPPALFFDHFPELAEQLG